MENGGVSIRKVQRGTCVAPTLSRIHNKEEGGAPKKPKTKRYSIHFMSSVVAPCRMHTPPTTNHVFLELVIFIFS